MKTMKKAVSFLVCVLMLINMLVIASAANVVDADMEWTTDFSSGEWQTVADAQPFCLTDFEPGSEAIRYFKIKNIGNRAFDYALSLICDGEIGSLAEVIDVYYSSDVAGNVNVSDMTNIGTLSEVINANPLSLGKMLPDGLTGEGFYTSETSVAIALKMRADAGSEYMGQSIGAGFKVSLTASECEFSYPPVEKFGLKFSNTEEYLYRVGNMNTVSLGSLFYALDGADISDVEIAVETIGTSTVTHTYSPNASDWTKGTIQFLGTGPVKVTVSDENSIPLSLNLEVVNAKNTTTAMSATANNVVLLNDVGLHTLEVSGGYTLYGNGFKMTAANDVMYDAMNAGFVVLKNATLDNVQIVCPNFSHSVIYSKNISESANQHAASSDPTSDAYGNVRSAVMIDGNSTIRNSYVHGGRVALFVRSGNILIDNSTISGGAAANIHAISAKKLTLRDVTLIQKPFQATVHDTSKTIMGLSGLFECDESGASTPLYLEGTLKQDAWINESYSKYIPSDLSSVVSVVLKKTDYLHDIDGDGTKEALNLGFTYIPQSAGGVIAPDVTDNRTNKSTVPYESALVESGLIKAYVHSYKNTNGTSSDFVLGDNYSYTPVKQGATAPAVSFADANADRVFATEFKADSGWTSALTVNLDNGNYNFNFSNLKMVKNGKELNYTVTEAGASVNKSNNISLTASGVRTFVLTVEDDEIYDANGEKTGTVAYHTYTFNLVATKTSIPEPEVADTTGGTPLLVVQSKGGDWSCAIPALEGIKIKYYTSATNSVTLDLATLTPSSTGKQNGTNNFWEISKDGYKLKVTCGYIHDTKQIYGMPVVVNNSGNKMYFTISSTNGFVSTNTSGRTVTLTYDFTDPNGKTLSFSKTWQFNYADYKSGKQYSYSDFVNGTLKEASSSCVTGDTLVTLADGSQKRIDEVEVTDKLLVWDFYNGAYAEVAPAIIFDHGSADNTVIKLKFEDETEIKVVNAHQFFDLTENKYVNVTPGTVDALVGHEFAKLDSGAYEAVKLADYEIYTEYNKAYGIISSEHYNIIVEGMLTTDFEEQDFGIFNYFEIGSDLKFDKEKVEADISEYGLYTYEDFEGYLTPELFDAFNVKYMKVAVGKGQYTYEGILGLIEKWIVQSDETDVVKPEAYEETIEEPFVYAFEENIVSEPVIYLATEDVTADTVVSGLNTITAATYTVDVALKNAQVSEDYYVCLTDEATFSLTAKGATTGYAIIDVDGDTYYTAPIANGESVAVTVKNAKGKTVAISASWGVASEAVMENNLIDLGEISVASANATESGATAVVKNTTKSDLLSANVYIAVYNTTTNTLVALNGETVDINANGGEKEISVTAELPENYEIKVFVWDNDLVSLIK